MDTRFFVLMYGALLLSGDLAVATIVPEKIAADVAKHVVAVTDIAQIRLDKVNLLALPLTGYPTCEKYDGIQAYVCIKIIDFLVGPLKAKSAVDLAKEKAKAEKLMQKAAECAEYPRIFIDESLLTECLVGNGSAEEIDNTARYWTEVAKEPVEHAAKVEKKTKK